MSSGRVALGRRNSGWMDVFLSLRARSRTRAGAQNSFVPVPRIFFGQQAALRSTARILHPSDLRISKRM
jgi:hypothetical protein